MSDEDGVTVRLADGEELYAQGGDSGRRAGESLRPARYAGRIAVWRDGWRSRPIRAACLDLALTPSAAARESLRAWGSIARSIFRSIPPPRSWLRRAWRSCMSMKYLGTDRPLRPRRSSKSWRAFSISFSRAGSEHVVGEAIPAEHDGRARLALCERAMVCWAGRRSTLTERPHVFLAGDWVGPAGMLADASAASAAESARCVLDHARHQALRRTELAPCHKLTRSSRNTALPWPAWRTGCSARWPTPMMWFKRPTCAGSRTDREAVQSPRAYLLSIVTRLCIDERQSVEARKMTYVGPWLPEPVVELAEADPGAPLETAESVSMALLLVLESLSPVERAAYLLRRIFDYDYDVIAQVLERSEPSCRQIVSRAEQRIHDQRPRFDADPVASGTADGRVPPGVLDRRSERPRAVLATDAVLYSDGGGKARAALAPIRGADKIARFFLGITKKAPAGPGMSAGFASMASQA